MPLPTDERLLSLSHKILEQFDAIFGYHPGFRPAHAKGALVTGTFTPSPQAASLTMAPHIQRPSTPVTVRFSDSPGIPDVPDNIADAFPRGMVTRFHLAEHSHTDIIAHSTDAFPARNGEEFLQFLTAVATSDRFTPSDPKNPKPIEKFLGSHPASLAFVQASRASRRVSPGKLISRSRRTSSLTRPAQPASGDTASSPRWATNTSNPTPPRPKARITFSTS